MTYTTVLYSLGLYLSGILGTVNDYVATVSTYEEMLTMKCDLLNMEVD